MIIFFVCFVSSVMFFRWAIRAWGLHWSWVVWALLGLVAAILSGVTGGLELINH